MNVGDMVTWTSQAGSYMTTKTGKIIKVLPANKWWSRSNYMTDFACMCDSGMRNHESYLVEVSATGKGKPKLYRPRVSALRKVEG